MTQRILVNGEWTASRASSTLEIRNPATAEIVDKVPLCGEADVDAAVQSARRAQPAWERLPGAEKALLMHEVARRIRADAKELATTMTLETGKALCESYDCIEWVAACFQYYAEVGRRSRGNSVPPVAHHQVNFTVKEPFGVVAAIVPFNFPLLLMAWKVAPAIAAGNTVVCKPPHQNPLSNLLMARAYEGLPPGVVNVITGDGRTGEMLVKHPGIDLVAFTGSTKSGRQIASQCGQELKKVNLELGGIDPFLVFEDADLDVAARGVAWARLLNSGQVCTSPKRIYVVEKIADEFVRRVVAHVKTLRLGDPRLPETDLGPLISKEALERIETQVAALKSEGAKLLHGGKRASVPGLAGWFYEPTVFDNVRHGGIATTEEIFGPVISILRVKDADEAIEKANDSRYGLGASVYTKSLEYSMKAMEHVRAGTFWVNDPLTDNDAAPFGGMRWSGVGRELGEEGLDAFREPKHVHIDYKMEAKAFWYPYKNRKLPADPHS